MGTVYLVHFDQPYYHAQHYLGWSEDVNARLDRHLSGNGSKLLRAVSKANIGFRVVRTWDGDRKLERRLHKQKNSPKLCPICKGKCEVIR